MSREKRKQFNIRLLRKNRKPEESFGPSFQLGMPRAMARVEWEGSGETELYMGQVYSNPPDWVRFLESRIAGTPPDGLFTGGAGAVLFVPIRGRFLAVCFGHAHITLSLDAFERQFGLIVTLNSVPRDQIRSLDTATPDAVTVQRRVQASRDSDLQAFGVNIYRDLARTAAGTPKDKNFAIFVAGKDALKIVTTDKVEEIDKLCKRVLDMYEEETYRNDFSWIDRMKIVEEKSVLDDLNGKIADALNDLRNGGHADIHMSPPEIVDYMEGNKLHYNGFGSRGENFESLSIEDYVAELDRCGFEGGIKEIREKHRVRAKKDGQTKFTEKWKVYDCFVFETELTKKAITTHYVLFAGNWYKVEDDYKKEVEEFYENIEKVNIVGPTGCVNETSLINDLHKNRVDLLKLDKVKINPAGVQYGNLEPCDFFSKNREFIHLKDGHSSGPISHLWFQGVVSAEAFISDRQFRVKLRKVVKTRSKGRFAFEKLLPLASKKPNRDNYKVVYGIMRKPYVDGTIGIPFFSKVSLQATARRLEELNISVAVELIKKP